MRKSGRRALSWYGHSLVVLLASVQQTGTACIIRMLTRYFKPFLIVDSITSSECLISHDPSHIGRQSKLPKSTTLVVSCWSSQPIVDHRECGKHHLWLTTPASAEQKHRGIRNESGMYRGVTKVLATQIRQCILAHLYIFSLLFKHI